MQKGQVLIWIIVGGLIITIAGGAYYLGRSNSPKSSPTPTVISQTPQPTLSPASTPDETANWKIYTSTQLSGSDLKPYILKYPASWNFKKEGPWGDVTLSKDNYTINIYQSFSEGSGFIFEGEVPNGPFRDYRGKKYVEVQSNIGTLRRVEVDISSKHLNLTEFDFCLILNKECVSSTDIGHIFYQVPKNYDEAVLREMDKIVSVLKQLDQKQSNSASVCTTESSSIKSLIDNFENLQMKRDALGVLDLFTAPTNSEDIDTYNFFTGKKTGSVGLYGNVTTNFQEPNYKISNGSIDSPRGCIVSVEEQRGAYSNAGASIGYQQPQPYPVTLEVVKQGNEWKVDNYYPTGSTPKKYGAWGY